MRCYPVGNQLPALDVRGLHIDGADAQLLVAEQTLIVRGHVVFDQIKVAIDLANKIGLVAAGVEIAMPDLPVVIRPVLADSDGMQQATELGTMGFAVRLCSL
jgi:hypothetical protein